MDRGWRWISLWMLTKLGKVCGQIKKRTDLYDMTLYNTRFGNAKQDIFSICIVCMCVYYRKDERTYIYASFFNIDMQTCIYSWTAQK